MKKMRCISMLVILVAGCTAPRPLTPTQMQALLESTGVESYEYTVASNGLTRLFLESGSVTDLSFLERVKVNHLVLSNTLVQSMQPLARSHLESLWFSPWYETNNVDVLRRIRSLKEINGMPSSDFWVKYDDGFFGVEYYEAGLIFDRISHRLGASEKRPSAKGVVDPFEVVITVDFPENGSNTLESIGEELAEPSE